MSLQSSGLPTSLKHTELNDAVNFQRPLLLEPECLSEDEARRRREQLNRRPSYRMILKELETVGADKTLKKEIDDTANMERTSMPAPMLPNNLNVNANMYSLPVSNGTGLCNTRGVASVSPASEMDANSVGSSSSNVFSPRSLTDLPIGSASDSSRQQGSNVLVHVSANDLLGIKPPNDAVARTVAANFIQNEWLNVYNSSTSPMGSVSGMSSRGPGMPGEGEDSNRKRQVRLLKNREAAKECRRKKKEYVKCLENRVAVLENQNKALIEELKTLKELYCRKEKAEFPDA
uniref:BZIP domain-containing protein n=1 Tax=Panagrellus redivivus TaxID=6233 RepID=A0A7E5A0V3_PANRE